MISFKDYCKRLNIKDKIVSDKILYSAYYLHKNSEDHCFTLKECVDCLGLEGIYISNVSREAKKIRDSRNYKKVKNDRYSLTNIALNKLSEEINFLEDEEVIETEGSLLDLKIFCGYRTYLDKLVLQANHCYENNCFDACATMMRRIFETLLIECYEKLNISDEIKDANGNYFMLEKICTNAKNNTTLALTRIKDELDTFRDLGNYASHRRYYNTFKSDIDNCKVKYRTLIEELMYKSGLK